MEHKLNKCPRCSEDKGISSSLKETKELAVDQSIWSTAPSWANYCGRDTNGRTTWFADMPSLSETKGYKYYYSLSQQDNNNNCSLRLWKRPKGTIEDAITLLEKLTGYYGGTVDLVLSILKENST